MPGSLCERPSSLLPHTCFSLPLLFRTPATQAFREGHHCNLIESQPYDGAPRAEINAGMPISLLQPLLFLPLLTQRTGSTSKYILSIDRSIQWNSANTAN